MMVAETTHPEQAQCIGCGFEAPAGSDVWETVNHPPIGVVTQCPDCGSTDVHSGV